MLFVRAAVRFSIFGLTLGWLLNAAVAQPPAAPKADDKAESPKVDDKKPRYRRLIPGVETTIPVDNHEEETFSQHDIVEILQGIPGLDWKPHSTGETRTLKMMATQAMFRKDVWNLEFTFKPMRMIWVDVPQEGGKAERKLIYYIVYHVKNPGRHFHAEPPPANPNNILPVDPAPDGRFKMTQVDMPVRFMPLFSLENTEKKKAYLDRLIPAAVPEIRNREDPNRPLLNSVEISQKPIEVSKEGEDKSVWGVVTWEDIDPTLDFFSVVIEGLSNAQKWYDPPNVWKTGDKPAAGRKFVSKMLVLNFWRPGDEFLPDERTIYFGAPGKIDYRWIYR